MPDGRPDGYRAQLAVYAGGRVLLRSRRGTDMTAAFPEIKAAALTQLPADTGLDSEPDQRAHPPLIRPAGLRRRPEPGTAAQPAGRSRER
ncbi:hypothetical protein [Streptomyces griseofuscus]|uniref:hypothetical protein n=1 Tax=Streptomyces griseofuscus TaxID=146922 RepID=UPI001FAB6FA7|nr:hypothetical protein [Streptomyces griseofuscus]